MESLFYPEEFFSLEDFEHQEVFDKYSPCWVTLQKIPQFLKNKQLGNIEVEIPSNVYLVNKELISIGQGTTLQPGAYIEGPCIIGKNCEIRHMSYIRCNTIIGNNCVIGHASEIKNSIFLNHAKAPHFNYVGDSIIGQRVNLGAGVVCANITLQHKEIVVKYLDKKFPTGIKKLGAIIGDDSSLGCHTVTNPGTFLKKRSLSRPGDILQGCFLKSLAIKQS